MYVDERITRKYSFPQSKDGVSALNIFEQSLIARYGTSKRTIYDYAQGKFPKYFIDTFADLKV